MWLNVHPALGTPSDVWTIALKKQANISRPQARYTRAYTLSVKMVSCTAALLPALASRRVNVQMRGKITICG